MADFLGFLQKLVPHRSLTVDNETDISGFRESLGAIEIANAVRKKSLDEIETAIRVFETQPRRDRDLDR